ncbi:hypothetical protein [Hydrogenophaga sp. 2FB]|uniref:hypothetical protein n=1 Tax=Hydrogenophaga sp. 2FB TaxID=2502187 RepID=UPI0010F80276|nr:hypothetical protein [Hydrogenophaga sp. 2FB]
MNKITSNLMALAASVCLALTMASTPARAQSEASVALSLLPVASVASVATSASVGAVAVSVLPVALSTAGAVLVVKTVESTARGTVYLLERASDGARVSVEVAASAVSGVVVGVGTVVTVSVIGTGVLLSAAGEVLAFIPNELGRALLHNERVTRQ